MPDSRIDCRAMRPEARARQVDALQGEVAWNDARWVVRHVAADRDVLEGDRLQWHAGEVAVREERLPATGLQQWDLRERNRPQSDRPEADGTQPDGAQTDGAQTDGSQTVRLHFDRTQPGRHRVAGNTGLDRAQADVFERDAAQADAAQADAAQAGGIDGAVRIRRRPLGEFRGDLVARNGHGPHLNRVGLVQEAVAARVDRQAGADLELPALEGAEFAAGVHRPRVAALVGRRVGDTLRGGVRHSRGRCWCDQLHGVERPAAIEDGHRASRASVLREGSDEWWGDEDLSDGVASAAVAHEVEADELRRARAVTCRRSVRAEVSSDDRVAHRERAAVAVDAGARARRRGVADDGGMGDRGRSRHGDGTTLVRDVAVERRVQHRGLARVAQAAALAGRRCWCRSCCS